MHTALWITAVGSAVLFGSIACLVGLMYLLTARWLFPKDERPPRPVRPLKRKRKFRRGVEAEVKRLTPRSVTPRSAVSNDAEHERRRKAAALAVAIAYAGTSPAALLTDVPSDWKLLHRARRLIAPALRRKARP
jgi:hypothetical protein